MCYALRGSAMPAPRLTLLNSRLNIKRTQNHNELRERNLASKRGTIGRKTFVNNSALTERSYFTCALLWQLK